MVYQYDIPELGQWIGNLWAGPAYYVFALFMTLVVLGLIGFIIALVRHGPAQAGEMTYKVFAGTFFDLVSLSPRRVWAVTRLVMLDAWRKRFWVVLVIYVIMLLFAGQYLAPNSQSPTKNSISFLLSFCTRYLVLIVVLFMSVFSIPTDFKTKTIFTITTKPLRIAEYVLGRILGFMLLATAAIVIMGLGGYLFLNRTLQHTHELDEALQKSINRYLVTQELNQLYVASQQGALKPDQLQRQTALAKQQTELKITPDDIKNFSPQQLPTGETTIDSGHSHRVTIDPNAEENFTEFEFAHQHRIVTQTNSDGTKRFVIQEPEELLRARVQHVGTLRFKDINGKDAEKGVNVGKEWRHRSYITGNSLAEAIWTFDDITRDRYPDGLFVERTLRVFRTEQGIIDQPLEGEMILRNPSSKVSSKPFPFKCKDNTIDSQEISFKGLFKRDIKGQDEPVEDFFATFVNEEHQLQIIVRCNAPRQYFGMAPRDLYLRQNDVSFAWNYLKGLICIWLQTLLVCSCGVLFSTTVSSPIALLATVGFLIMGMYSQFNEEVFTATLDQPQGTRVKNYVGGGPLESFYRIVTQKGAIENLDKEPLVNVLKLIDFPLLHFNRAVNKGIPNFDEYNTLTIVGQGFDIPNSLLIVLIFKACYFALIAFLVGIGLMRLREVAK